MRRISHVCARWFWGVRNSSASGSMDLTAPFLSLNLSIMENQNKTKVPQPLPRSSEMGSKAQNSHPAAWNSAQVFHLH